MQIVTFSRNHLRPIALFDAIGASNLRVGGGSGESHVYALRFEPGGSVGAHPAGYGQLFLVVEGQAWAAGADGARVPLSAGEGAYFSPGELHSKGSDTGCSVIMVQAEAIEPDASATLTHA